MYAEGKFDSAPSPEPVDNSFNMQQTSDDVQQSHAMETDSMNMSNNSPGTIIMKPDYLVIHQMGNILR